MSTEQLRNRTKAFAIEVVRFCRTLPRHDEGRIFARQLLRAGTSVGANYRAACRPQSDADFVAKMAIVIEECDEAAFWLELASDVALISNSSGARLLKEADELTRIFVVARRTVQRRLGRL